MSDRVKSLNEELAASSPPQTISPRVSFNDQSRQLAFLTKQQVELTAKNELLRKEIEQLKVKQNIEKDLLLNKINQQRI